MKAEEFRRLNDEQWANQLEQLQRWIDETQDQRLKSELQQLIVRMSRARTKTTKPLLDGQKEVRRRRLQEHRDKVSQGPNRAAPWSEEDEKLVLESDLEDADLAKKLGRTYAAVAQRRHVIRKRLGLPFEQRKLKKDGGS